MEWNNLGMTPIKLEPLFCPTIEYCMMFGWIPSVGRYMEKTIGVTDNFGVISKPIDGMLYISVTDDFGDLKGWTMGRSYS